MPRGRSAGCSASGCARQRPALRNVGSSLSATKALRDPRSILIFAWWVSGEGQCRDETRRDAVYRPFLGSGCGRNIRTHLLRAAARPTSLFYRDLGAPRPRPLRAPRILDTACLARQVIESSLTHSLETARSSIMHVEFDRWMIGGSGSSASGPISTLSSGAMATPLYVLCQRVVYRSGVHTHRYAQLATTLPACS